MSRRTLRAWLALWIVLMICTTYIAGWVFYSTMHQRTVGLQLPPGQGVTRKGVELRIVSMHQSRVVSGKYDSYAATPGATWVIVTFEATVTPTENFCHTELVGHDGRRWDYSTKVSGRERSFACFDFEPGTPTLGELIFEIPEAEASRLMGMTAYYDRDWAFRTILLRPPA